MANDIQMWKDALHNNDLMKCYIARYIEGNFLQAETLKGKFIKKYGYWGNYY